MTRFCVEDILTEELNEKGLNAIDLLQEHAKKQSRSIKVTYYINTETREKLIEAGIDDMEELKVALLKCFDDVDVIIEEKIEQC